MSEFKHVILHHINRIIRIVAVVALIVLLGVGANASYAKADPLFGARTEYQESTYDTNLYNLISTYYEAYSNNDIETLEKIASPISDMEKSYIAFLSEYLDNYQVVEIFSKPGAGNGCYLVSVNVDVNFKDVKSSSPGLDFFYVTTDKEGNLKIDNRYSAFNQLYHEVETEEDVQALYNEFEIQEDVNLLRIRIQNNYNALMNSDEEFSAFINGTLPQAAAKWAGDYQAAIEAALAEEEAARVAAEEEAKRLEEEEAARVAAEEAEQQRAQEEQNAVTMEVTDEVNIRAAADIESAILTKVQPGTLVLKYGEEGEWSSIKYADGRAYIRSDFLRIYVPNNEN